MEGHGSRLIINLKGNRSKAAGIVEGLLDADFRTALQDVQISQESNF
jgi:hypothetical protein